jgi:hypothetical protein
MLASRQTAVAFFSFQAGEILGLSGEYGCSHMCLLFGRKTRHAHLPSLCMLPRCMQLGYLQSWSAYETYRTQHPERPDPLVAFKQQLLEALGAEVGAVHSAFLE